MACGRPGTGRGDPASGDAAPGYPASGDPAGDKIAALVGSWSLDQAEQVARAFTVYFHLANLAEEHQRIRILRERDAGPEPVRSRSPPRSPSSGTTRAAPTSASCSGRCACTWC